MAALGIAFDPLKHPPTPANDHTAARGCERAPRLTRFSAADLQHMVFPPVRYVVDGYIGEGLTILAGKPKLGKSWLVLDFCVAAASGGFTLGQTKCAQGDVLYCALEDNPRRMKNRLDKVCRRAFPSRLDIWTELPAIDRGGVDCLREWIDEHPEAVMIVVDTLMPIRPAKKGNEDPYMYDSRTIRPLKDLADEYSIAIVVVHHTRKAETADPLESVSGTNGLNGAADATLVLDRGSNGVTLYGRGRDIEEIETALDFERDVCRWRALGDADDARRSDTRNKIIAVLRDAGEPLGPKEIADVAGLKEGNVRPQLLKMAKAGEITKHARGKYAL